MNQEYVAEVLRGLLVLARDRFGVVRQEADAIRFDYAAGPIALCGYLQLNAEMRAVLLRIVIPMPVAPERIALVAEYITRVNYEVPVGCWALNLDSGEVRWKSGFYFGGEVAPPEVVVALVDSSKAYVYRYLFGITRLMIRGTIEEAMAEIGSDHGEGTLR